MGRVTGANHMAKRRNVLAGLGALAFGSGAMTMSGAFSGNASTPESDLRVIADAQLRVRAARGGSGSDNIVADYNTGSNVSSTSSGNRTLQADDVNVTEKDLYGSWDDFYNNSIEGLIDSPGAPRAVGLEINDGENDNLGLRLGVTNGITASFEPLLEVVNNSNNTHDVGIHYADNSTTNDSLSGETHGYGGDVDIGGSYTADGTNTVSRQVVQEIYQFKIDDANPGGRSIIADESNQLVDRDGNNVSSASGGELISPDPATSDPADESEQFIRLGTGDAIFVKLDFNTDWGSEAGNLTDAINSAAAGGDPFTSSADLNLLNNIYVSTRS